jgi:hypothetical protein
MDRLVGYISTDGIEHNDFDNIYVIKLPKSSKSRDFRLD